MLVNEQIYFWDAIFLKMKFITIEDFKPNALNIELDKNDIRPYEIIKLTKIYPAFDARIQICGTTSVTLTSHIHTKSECGICIIDKPHFQLYLPMRRRNRSRFGIYCSDVVDLLRPFVTNGILTTANFNTLEKIINQLYPMEKFAKDVEQATKKRLPVFSDTYIKMKQTKPCARFSTFSFDAPPLHQLVKEIIYFRKNPAMFSKYANKSVQEQFVNDYNKTMLAFPPSWILLIFRTSAWKRRLEKWNENNTYKNNPKTSKYMKWGNETSNHPDAMQGYIFMNLFIPLLFQIQFANTVTDVSYIKKRNKSWCILLACKFSIISEIVIRCMKRYDVSFNQMCKDVVHSVSYEAKVKYKTSPRDGKKAIENQVWNKLKGCRYLLPIPLEMIYMIAEHHMYESIPESEKQRGWLWYKREQYVYNCKKALYNLIILPKKIFFYQKGSVVEVSFNSKRGDTPDVAYDLKISRSLENIKEYARSIFLIDDYIVALKKQQIHTRFLGDKFIYSPLFLKVWLDCVFKDKLVSLNSGKHGKNSLDLKLSEMMKRKKHDKNKIKLRLKLL